VAGDSLRAGEQREQVRDRQQAEQRPAPGQHQDEHADRDVSQVERQAHLGRPAAGRPDPTPALHVLADRADALLLEDELQLVVQHAEGEQDGEQVEAHVADQAGRTASPQERQTTGPRHRAASEGGRVRIRGRGGRRLHGPRHFAGKSRAARDRR
jgi:hypothetical protein